MSIGIKLMTLLFLAVLVVIILATVELLSNRRKSPWNLFTDKVNRNNEKVLKRIHDDVVRIKERRHDYE